MNGTTEMLKGILEGIILEIINEHETYGYEITSRLQQMGFDDIAQGTVYTVLLRLEKKQLVTVSSKKSTQGPMRKFYALNAAGQVELATFWQRWQFIEGQMNTLKGAK
ncbi:PadR family transcriptional regulator [Lacticaseibacillus hulanensis]|uniref:PadR family transcriptional regulator n=1 Tax=Lacticaseibacillus hulanensis TaxID=2493111 RepID=UPI000FDC6B38|nr:PadR family transcriptional regulator [Lacticaseibacillus hulanensis]